MGAAQARAATAAHVAADAGTGGAGGRPYATGCFAILAIMANGVFQEEAIFAPLALGIVMGLAGLLLGRLSRGNPGPWRDNSPRTDRPFTTQNAASGINHDCN